MQITFQIEVQGRRQTFGLVPGESFLIGRAVDQDLSIEGDPGVSKTHARIWAEGGRLVLEDAGSRNGTYVNSVPVLQPYFLQTGDVITMGATVLVFFGEESLTNGRRRAPAVGTAPHPGMTCVISLKEFEGKSGPMSAEKEKQTAGATLRLGILQEIATNLLDMHDLDDLFQRCMTLILSAIPARRGCIMMQEDGELHVKALSAKGEGQDSQDILHFSNTIRMQVMEERKAVLTANAEGDPSLEKAQSVIVQGIKSVMCVPLWNAERVYGLIYLDSSINETSFNEKNLRLLTAIANLVTMKIENFLYIQELLAKKALEKDLALASEIQNLLLPKEFPPIRETGTALRYLSCSRLGGDYYHCFEQPDGRHCVIIADVMGKGTSAALLTTALHAVLSVSCKQEQDIRKIVAHANRFVCELCNQAFFITLFALVLDSSSHTLEYCNAGHNSPLHCTGDGRVTPLVEGGPLLGFSSSVSYASARIGMNPGDLIFLFTDGVSEVENECGEMVDKEFLARFAANHCTLGPEEFLQALWASLESFRGASALQDDTTAIVLKRMEAS